MLRCRLPQCIIVELSDISRRHPNQTLDQTLEIGGVTNNNNLDSKDGEAMCVLTGATTGFHIIHRVLTTYIWIKQPSSFSTMINIDNEKALGVFEIIFHTDGDRWLLTWQRDPRRVFWFDLHVREVIPRAPNLVMKETPKAVMGNTNTWIESPQWQQSVII